MVLLFLNLSGALTSSYNVIIIIIIIIIESVKG